MDDPKLAKNKRDSARMLELGFPIGLPLGVSMGFTMGLVLESIALGVALGLGCAMAFSVVIGAARLQDQDKTDTERSVESDTGVE